MDDLLERLLDLYEHTPVLVAAYDGFDRLRYANRAFRAAFFVGPDEQPSWSEIIRRNHREGRGTVIRNPDLEAWLTSTQSRRGKVGYRAFETDMVDGSWLYMTETVQPNGWMLCIASDVTRLRPDERSVRQDLDFAIKASNTDELTGVANRRYTMARAAEMLQARDEARSGNGAFALLDLDHFKSINDRFGHQTGDRILEDFVKRLQPLVRRADCFGRVGGEEFALVLPKTPVEEAVLIVEKMLSMIRMNRPLPERPDFAYTFSAGVAAIAPADTLTDLYGRADKALYLAKVSGRNRIEVNISQRNRSSATL
ncbi:GGDEF domain-containing protein [Amorphus coralli]|uniref:GGDEF domain-containing protein n=1 Tax=Amorphus coralli TaxID=340680 RepID=UPI00037C0DA0|nr:GGDEF domain-containing protein [Amorphus coralli]